MLTMAGPLDGDEATPRVAVSVDVRVEPFGCITSREVVRFSQPKAPRRTPMVLEATTLLDGVVSPSRGDVVRVPPE